MLLGIGDSAIGEWLEEGAIATHVRRRLSESEALTVGPVVDVRGTDDALRRLRAVWRELPEVVRAFAEKEAAGGLT